jgi:endonuclease/exonuclease/phosphatase family metal-dependent hydrolase
MRILFFFSVILLIACNEKEKKQIQNTVKQEFRFVNEKTDNKNLNLEKKKFQQDTSIPLLIISWNIANFGGSKDDKEIAYMAKKLRNADIVAIQEVVIGPKGAQAIAKLVDELNRTGAKWDYVLSEPTNGPGTERYAFLFKTKNVNIKQKGFLIKELDNEIDREPFYQKFEVKGNGLVTQISLVNIHTVPKSKGPEKEIQALARLHTLFPNDKLLVMGDFNTSQNSTAFQALKDGNCHPALNARIKTTLKMQPDPANNEHYANDYDNIYCKRPWIEVVEANKIDLTTDIPNVFPDLKSIRQISDHVPVYAKIKVKP